MSFPETLIVGINTHGEIPLDNNGNPFQMTIPENMCIIKIDSVTPGVKNASTLNIYEKISENVSNYIETEYNETDDISKTANDITNIAVQTNTENIENIKKDYNKYNNQDLANYVYHYNKSFKINKYYPNSTLINKNFTLFTKEEEDKYEIDIESIFFFNKIIIYNMDNTNVFTLIREFMDPNIEQITLFELIELLTQMGAKNIIFLDLSCSVFTPIDNTSLTERSIRTKRRNILKSMKSPFSVKNQKKTNKKTNKITRKRKNKRKNKY